MAPPKIGPKIIVRISSAHAALIEEAPGETLAERLRWVLDDYMRLKDAPTRKKRQPANAPA